MNAEILSELAIYSWGALTGSAITVSIIALFGFFHKGGK